MLIWMRNSTYAGVIKFFLMGLLVLAVAGLVLTDVGGFFRGVMSSNTLVKGGDVNISVQEFDRTLRRVIAQRGIGPQEAYQLGLVDNVLSSEIQGRLFTNESRAIGLEISDDMVTRQIAKLAEPLATNGQSKRDALMQILRQQSISEGEFVESIRLEMANTLLRAAIQPAGTLSSPLMAKALYRYDNEKRDAQIIVFKNSDILDVVKPNNDQIQKYYDANKMDFLIPESRTITIATLKPSMVTNKIDVSDEQILADYNKNIAGYTKPSRRAISQAVFDSAEKAQAAFDDIKAGKKVSGFNAQELEENGLLPEIAKPLFAAKKGDVIGPIETSLGFHVIKLNNILAESITPFEKVKDKLRKDAIQTASADAFFKTGVEIEDRAAGGDKLDDIVKEYGMTTEKIGAFRRNGNNADGKDLLKIFESDKSKIIESAYDTNVNEIAPMVETADGQFHLIRVDTIVPNSYRALSDVKSSLVKRWMDEQQRLSNQARLKSAMEAAKADKSLADIAKENKAKIVSLSNINRQSAPTAPLTPVIAAQIFNSDIDETFSSEIDGGFVIGAATKMTLPPKDSNPSKDELEQLEELTARALPQEILTQYIQKLTDNKKIEINKPVLENLYAPKDAVK